MENYSDQWLIKDYLKGEEKSLEILIQRYLKPIYVFAHRYANNPQDAEDITQETFVKTWRNLRKFNEDKNFKFWIFSIAKNTAIDFLRRKKSVPFSQLEVEKGEAFLEKFADSSLLPNHLLERKDMMGLFAKAINMLLPKYRKILILRDRDNLTFREISESLDESINTVKSRYRRAAIMLKKSLSEQ